ncbi:MAG: peptide deformylase [Planctomycetota bacterium]
MAIDTAGLRIQIYPAEILRQKSDEIDPTAEVMAVADRMVELMRGADGIGLAANQVGLPWRLFVAHVPAMEGGADEPGVPFSNAGPEVFVNPVIESSEGDPEIYEEGCLSLPGINGDVIRPPVVTVSAIGRDGERFTRKIGGLLARCVQHELDHLDGVLILDRMTQMSRTRVRRQVQSLEKNAR